MGNNTEAQDIAEAAYEASPVEMAKALAEAREALRGYEASALADVAATLAKAAESLARTSRELRDLSPDEWMDTEEAAFYLKRTPKTFRNIVAAGEIPDSTSRSAGSSLAARSSMSGS